MKKMYFYQSGAVLLLFLMILGCREKFGTKNEGLKDQPRSTFCETCKTDVPELSGMIQYQTAVALSANYRQDRGKRFVWNGDKVTNVEDASSIWFELDRIKAFVHFVESQLCNAGCSDSITAGIRIYYARYPDTVFMSQSADLKGQEAYANKHTLFMIPAYKIGKAGRWIDFNPAYVRSGCTIAPIEPTQKNAAFMPLVDPDGSEGGNHGGLAPPPPTGTYPTY